MSRPHAEVKVRRVRVRWLMLLAGSVAGMGAASAGAAAPQRVFSVAGTGKEGGPVGDGGPATRARITDATDVAWLPDGSFLIADHTRVRRVSRGGVITTVAGTPEPGSRVTAARRLVLESPPASTRSGRARQRVRTPAPSRPAASCCRDCEVQRSDDPRHPPTGATTFVRSCSEATGRSTHRSTTAPHAVTPSCSSCGHAPETARISIWAH
jgi:hypothetical protein